MEFYPTYNTKFITRFTTFIENGYLKNVCAIAVQANIGKIKRNDPFSSLIMPGFISQLHESRGVVHFTLSFFVNLQQKR